ncbi:DNA-directed RNA polymerase subunit alpha [Priestia megaterium]|uniref:DNA-directed RNA polymerase subunit alpha n=1 Tax=Priestia megaterium TaxID=1404 RepID=UPI002E1DECF6|nr:DNA-directed RNA polymerase subunit alpha [Priestia megaterium]MED4285393.1 DNA-directed RNA polymerase subunit alpha [Priestia megaterium]
MNLDFKKIEILVDKEITKDNFSRIYIEPLERGYGLTLGTALRRVMLSSMPGTSVVGFRMQGVTHQLMTMPGTATDAVELVSNLKKLKFELAEDKLEKVVFKASKAGIYKASHLKLPKGVELKTPDIDLVNVLGEKEVEIEIYIKKGRGFVQASEHTATLNVDNLIGVDGLFSPIKRVATSTEDIRTGDIVTHERLVLDVETFGNINPKEAVMLSAKIIKTHFDFFEDMKDRLTEYEIYKEKEKEVESINNMTIEELKLSVRSTNALTGAKIRTVGELRKMTETELADLRNMGKTSVDEVKKVLTSLGVVLGDF